MFMITEVIEYRIRYGQCEHRKITTRYRNGRKAGTTRTHWRLCR